MASKQTEERIELYMKNLHLTSKEMAILLGVKSYKNIHSLTYKYSLPKLKKSNINHEYTYVERLLSHFVEGDIDECWVWDGATTNSGYGSIGRTLAYKNTKTIGAHRAVYEHYTKEQIPNGMYACHTCDNKLCVNPNHIFIGSNKDNQLDLISKGLNLHDGVHRNAKLTVDEIIEIKQDIGTHSHIGMKYNVSRSVVGRIKNNQVHCGVGI